MRFHPLTPFATAILALALLVQVSCQECEVPPPSEADTDSAAAMADTTPKAQLAAGWNVIRPGGDTTCSDGSPYHFYVRPGRDSHLLFHLQGGGACWSGATCDPDLEPSFRVHLGDVDPEARRGIFDFDHPDNPFADYTVVLAPYCTGDVHLGDNEVTYDAPAVEGHAAHPVTVRFRGLDNVQAVMDWTQQHLSSPEAIFVTGSSAGSIPSPYYAMRLAETYPQARIVQLGDGSGGYRGLSNDPPHLHWGTLKALSDIPEFAAMAPEDMDFEALFAVAVAHQPGITFTQYDTAEDDVQHYFLKLAEAGTSSLLQMIRANQDDIRAEVPEFRSFIAGGELHTILLRPEVYTYRVGEVRLVDWIADLAAGKPVEDVHCVDCGAAELVVAAEAEP